MDIGLSLGVLVLRFKIAVAFTGRESNRGEPGWRIRGGRQF